MNIPYEHAKRFLVAHLHQQRANEEAQPLTVANLFVIQTEAFQHSAKHALSLSSWIFEHIHARKASAQVLVDGVVVRTRGAIQHIILVFDQAISRARRALPDHASQRSGYATAYFVEGKSGESLDGLWVVTDEGSPELELGHGRRRGKLGEAHLCTVFALPPNEALELAYGRWA